MKKCGKCFGMIILFLILISGLLFAYTACYYSIPSHMRLLTEKEHEIDFEIPASASIETPTGKMMANLNQPITMVTGRKIYTY